MTEQTKAPPSPLPATLPKVLPVGTRGVGCLTGKLRIAKSKVTLVDGAQPYYEGRWALEGDVGREASILASYIDWSSVPLPASAPFLSRADVFREKGLCIACGAEAKAVIQSSWSFAERPEAVGAKCCESCRSTAWGTTRRRYDEARSTPADPESAAPAPESDEAWLRGKVFELTGERVSLRKEPLSEDFILETARGISQRRLLVCADTAFACDRAALTRGLRDCGWPLKDSAGVGSAPRIADKQWVDEVKASHARPDNLVFGIDPGISEGRAAVVTMRGGKVIHIEEATRTTPAVYCAECPLPSVPGMSLCVACAARRKRQEQSVLTMQNRCGPGCSCVYCRYREANDSTPAECSRMLEDTFTDYKQPAARGRLGALESRERRLNDPSPAQVRMLDGARDALRHWPAADDGEP